MRKIIGIMVLSLILILPGIPGVSAIHYIPECQASGNLLWVAELNKTVDGDVKVYNLTYPEVCEFGCEDTFDICNPSEVMRYIVALGVIFGIVAVFVVIKNWKL